jgi:hypothetical protein
LEALEPAGEMDPYEPPPGFADFGRLDDGNTASSFETPEPLADQTAKSVMNQLLHSRGMKARLREEVPWRDSILAESLAAMADTYDESDARRDLGIQIGDPRETDA